MRQLTIFDAPASQAAKQSGMDRAAANAVDILSLARGVARSLASERADGITADDIVERLVRLGYSPHALGNAAGSLFRGREWRWTGERRKSARVHAHANELKVWKLEH